MIGQRLRRWPIIKPTAYQRIVLVGMLRCRRKVVDAERDIRQLCQQKHYVIYAGFENN